jgi:hypothetical protein
MNGTHSCGPRRFRVSLFVTLSSRGSTWSRSFNHRGRLIPSLLAGNCVLRDVTGLTNSFWCRHLNWRERLFLEENAGCGFDGHWCETSGFSLQDSGAGQYPVVRLLDMGPKLLISNKSTADQNILRWRLRVTGNTAVEFGVIPVDLEPNQNSLHKTDAVKGNRAQRCTGFCSQITAGSHLPVKVPVVRGTMVDLVASRGLVQIVLFYPNDAQEIKWNRDGHPVPAPYQGPRVLRFELEFVDTFDIKLAVTCWAKASFDVIHSSPPLPPQEMVDDLPEEVENNLMAMDEDIIAPVDSKMTSASSSSSIQNTSSDDFCSDAQEAGKNRRMFQPDCMANIGRERK